MNTKLNELSLLDVNEPLLQGLKADLESGTKAVIRSGMLTEALIAAEMKTADVIIHCTPVGMHPKVDASLIPAELFSYNFV